MDTKIQVQLNPHVTGWIVTFIKQPSPSLHYLRFQSLTFSVHDRLHFPNHESRNAFSFSDAHNSRFLWWRYIILISYLISHSIFIFHLILLAYIAFVHPLILAF